jgi:hypothetical protein
VRFQCGPRGGSGEAPQRHPRIGLPHLRRGACRTSSGLLT